MNDRINNLRNFIFNKEHHKYRRSPEEIGLDRLADNFSKRSLSDMERTKERLSILLENEFPIILPGEKIVFTRTITSIPDIYTKEEWAKIKETNFIHELGTVSNINPDYEDVIIKGFDKKKEEIQIQLDKPDTDKDGRVFLNAAYNNIIEVQKFIAKYENYAYAIGEEEIAGTLKNIKTEGAKNFWEALQLLRIIHFVLWESSTYHNTFGRFDQYMYPFYIKDIKSGKLSKAEAFDLLEEFFLTCNKDSDLYPGIQQGDNGQSLVLGGTSLDGEQEFNELSELCLKASYELCLIDPKINIRVNKNTPLEIYEKGSELTKIGLGFPQYSNDDIVIPGLLKKGYSLEDAHNYAVAACWEFIIPKYGMDIPNIDALSFADCVLTSIDHLDSCSGFEDFYSCVAMEIQNRVDTMCENHKNLYIVPAPFMSVLMAGTIENARDISFGAKYNNFGIHGTGIATATDSLAAIKKYYFEEHKIDFTTLVSALKNNFEGYEDFQKILRNEAPKMGQNEDYADDIAAELLSTFDAALENKRNEREGVYRAGTGTALFYVNHSCKLGATPDGRFAGEFIPANYSPSLFINQKGPVSVIQSFAKPDLTKTINGGPLTLEFDQSVFNNQESISKLAMLVRSFIHLGGHQLQLNTINRGKLLDAKIHPENYRNLIVRVWGWSGYFVELNEAYQDHVISRLEYGLQ
jgi:pyruvate-formate lyase